MGLGSWLWNKAKEVKRGRCWSCKTPFGESEVWKSVQTAYGWKAVCRKCAGALGVKPPPNVNTDAYKRAEAARRRRQEEHRRQSANRDAQRRLTEELRRLNAELRRQREAQSPNP